MENHACTLIHMPTQNTTAVSPWLNQWKRQSIISPHSFYWPWDLLARAGPTLPTPGRVSSALRPQFFLDYSHLFIYPHPRMCSIDFRKKWREGETSLWGQKINCLRVPNQGTILQPPDNAALGRATWPGQLLPFKTQGSDYYSRRSKTNTEFSWLSDQHQSEGSRPFSTLRRWGAEVRKQRKEASTEALRRTTFPHLGKPISPGPLFHSDILLSAGCHMSLVWGL